MPVNLTKMEVYEILEIANKKRYKKNRVEALQEYNCLALRDVLKFGFDPVIKSALPDGLLEEGKHYMAGSAESPAISLHKASKRFVRFVETGAPRNAIQQAKIEKMFLEMLEGLSPSDALLVQYMKDKRIDELFENIDAETVDKAFPGLLSSVEEKEVVDNTEDS